jgi:peroxiredoxin Q/BCP
MRSSRRSFPEYGQPCHLGSESGVRRSVDLHPLGCCIQKSWKERTFTATASSGRLSRCARVNVIFTGVQLSKDDTPGCTKEACSFRDANHEMQKHGVIVLGVSTDSVESHEQFAEKDGLPFPLLSDTDAQVAQLYDVYKEKTMYGKTSMGVVRSTFLIDKDGIMRKIWHKVRPEDHANEVLQTIETLHL